MIKDERRSKHLWRTALLGGWARKCSASTFNATTELVANGGFESSFDNWTQSPGDGDIADETSAVHSGSHAAKLTAGPNCNALLNSGLITLKIGGRYLLTSWTRGDGTYAGRYGVYDFTNDGWLIALGTTGVTGTSYTQITKVFTLPAGSSRVYICVQCPNTDTGIAYFDDVSLKRISDDE